MGGGFIMRYIRGELLNHSELNKYNRGDCLKIYNALILEVYSIRNKVSHAIITDVNKDRV